MRLCDFIRYLHGDLTIKIFVADKDGYFNKLLRENTLDDLEKECKKSFNPLCGFNNELWEMKVSRWHIWDNVVHVSISK
jgi:hypothetical protein